MINFPKTIEVNQHRAPTDDSIRLAHEMEDQTRDAVLKKYVLQAVDDTRIDAGVVEMRRGGLDHWLVVGFNLNGHPVLVNINADDFKIRLMSERGSEGKVLEAIAEEVRNAIAAEVAKLFQEHIVKVVAHEITSVGL